MAYTPTTWSDGDVITAEKLNKLEQGVKNEQVENQQDQHWTSRSKRRSRSSMDRKATRENRAHRDLQDTKLHSSSGE